MKWKPASRAILMLSSFLFSFYSSSVFPAASRTVDVDALIELILSDNPEIKLSKTLVNQADARLDGAKWKYFPKPTGSVSYFTQDQSQITNANNNPGIPTVGFGGQTGFTAKVGVSLNIFNGFQDRHRELQRRKEFEKSSRDVEATRLSQFDKIVDSIYTILRLQSDKRNIEEKIEIEKERALDVRKRVRSQVTKKSDLLSIEASVLGSQSDLQATLSDLSAEWQTLRSLSNLDLPFDAIETPDRKLTSLAQFEKVGALPELKSAQLDLDASALSAKVSYGALLPSVDVSFNQYLLRPEIQKNNHWDMQVVATIPLPFDGEKRAALRESNAVTLQKEATLWKKKKEKTAELENLVSNYNAGIERHQTLSEAVEIQAQLVEALKNDYRYGLSSISDYLLAVSTLLQKKQERDHLFFQELERAYQIQQYKTALGDK